MEATRCDVAAVSISVSPSLEKTTPSTALGWIPRIGLPPASRC
jgi:hypothetical protein